MYQSSATSLANHGDFRSRGMCQRLSRFPYSVEPHRPRAVTGSVRCGTELCAVAVMDNARAQSLATSLTLSLMACSSFPEREEFPMSRSLGSIQQLIFSEILVQRYRTYVYALLMCARTPEWPAGWGGD